MSEPILRRSSRNVPKKDVSALPPPTAPASRKRASAEPQKPTAKKVKTAAGKAVKAKAAEIAPSEGAEKAPKAVTKSTAKASAESLPGKPAKTAKVTKADGAAERLKDGDYLPKELPEVQAQDGTKATIHGILETAKKGIIIFAFPKASTPGCTTQACLFQDNFSAFSEAGYTVYGLSGDTPSQNEKFKTKQNLGYTLLCDPTYELHEKFAIKKKPKGTIRSVIIIAKTEDDGKDGNSAKILRSSPASPQISLQIAKEVVGIDHASLIAAAAAAEADKTTTSAAETTAATTTTLPVTTTPAAAGTTA